MTTDPSTATAAAVRRTTTPDGGAARPSFLAALAAVYVGQLSRARVARGPLLFVATLQSIGILLLLRGVMRDTDLVQAGAVVAGATILVVAFVALNLLAQRFGALRASGALDYYAALPIPPAAVVLATAGSYATFTVPGALVTALVGALAFDLPLAHLWMVLPAVVAAGVALSGVGAAVGLAMPRPELATLAGQLGMTAVLFFGIIPPGHLPVVLRAVRDLLPSTYAVDALALVLRGDASWSSVCWRLAVTVGYGGLALAASSRLFRRAVAR